ncbi:peptidoglycan-binding domain-containing protein [Planobispora takensis]|uniref:Peptidoglycan-binding protein n=1 Tax=Planobispora takensis TaxID=1367882 RepID=A0A8J3WV33_9ACTN|nr:peptidoglycan-binding domain-containing protein [Planobispora takensis]GII03386.1 peptidoglycan-binding protein [Planobispora takensis]
MRRGVTALAGVVVLAGAGGAWAVLRRPAPPVTVAAPSTATAQVVRADVAERTQVNGILSHAGSHQVHGAGGTLTRLPAVGAVITRGRAVYEADGRKVPLLYGARPAWRTLTIGTTGADVLQLERNLKALGYTGFTVDRTYSPATYYAVRRWQDDTRLPVTGTVPLGQVVFLPRALRVTAHDATPGSPARGPVLHGTGTALVVSVQLDPAQVARARVGNRVLVTLPDGSERRGKVTAVSPVATVPQSTEEGQPQATVPVTIRMSGRPVRALDRSLVQVALTTREHRDVLAVPVVALLARPGGAYEVVSDGRRVPVEAGLFDETTGLVEVTGLSEGQSVEVPGDAA